MKSISLCAQCGLLAVVSVAALGAVNRATVNMKPVIFELEPNARFVGTDAKRWKIFTRAGVMLSPSVSVEFSRPDPGMRMEGIDLAAATLNVYQGSNPLKWKRSKRSYDALAYRGLYSGIDLIYHVTPSGLKGDFVVQPHASPDQIRFRFVGANVHVGPEKIQIRSRDGSLTETIPHVYELEPTVASANRNHRIERRAHYREFPDGSIGIQIDQRNPLNPLVIDPDLTFSTYVAGSQVDQITATAYDASQSQLLVAGWTQSPDLLGASPGKLKGSTDGFLGKFSVSAKGVISLVSMDLIGGSGIDKITSVTAYQGIVAIGGSTTSADFPVSTTPSAIQNKLLGTSNGFLTMLGPNTYYSTYIGGSGADEIDALSFDSNYILYFGGTTTSRDLRLVASSRPFAGGGSDGFVGTLNPTGTFGFLSYLGGSGNDSISGLAQKNFEIVVTGGTDSSDFPTVAALQTKFGGGQDAFVTKISLISGQIIYSTFLGGRGGSASVPEIGAAVAISPTGDTWVAGTTSSPDFPLVQPVQAFLAGSANAFLAKLSPTGSLTYSTYLGGNSSDQINAIALLNQGLVAVAGTTTSSSFPTRSLPGSNQPLNGSAPGSALKGASDGFASVFTSSGSLVWSAFLGGSGSDSASGIAANPAGELFVVGTTTSSDFPVVNAVQSSPGGNASHGFISRISFPQQAGVFRPSTGQFFLSSYLDFSKYSTFSWANVNAPGAVPVVGDWDNTGRKRIGLYSSGTWYLDIDGDNLYTPGVDLQINHFGLAGVIPVVGDWDNTGRDRLGFFQNGLWYLDLVGDHTLRYTPQSVFSMGGVGDYPVVGDWTNSGQLRLGTVRKNHWLLDLLGNHVASTNYNFGAATDVPLFADWDNTGRKRIGAFRTQGYPIGWWFVDLNANAALDNFIYPCGPDNCFSMGGTGDLPVVGIGGSWFASTAVSGGSPSVWVSPFETTIPTSGQQVFSAQLANLPGGVAWAATAGSITATGVFTAPPTPTSSITITATSLSNPSVFGTATVTIAPATAPVFKVSPIPGNVPVGAPVNFTIVTSLPSGGTAIDHTEVRFYQNSSASPSASNPWCGFNVGIDGTSVYVQTFNADGSPNFKMNLSNAVSSAANRSNAFCSLGAEGQIPWSIGTSGKSITVTVPVTFTQSSVAAYHLYLTGFYLSPASQSTSTIDEGLYTFVTPLCAATAQQLSNRTSTLSSSTFQSPNDPPHMPPLPAFQLNSSSFYCDPLFGYPVLRLSDNSLQASPASGPAHRIGMQGITPSAGQNPRLAFNADGTKIRLSGGAIYTLDKSTLRVTNEEALYAVPTLDGSTIYSQYTGGELNGPWHPTDPNRLIASYVNSERSSFLVSVNFLQPLILTGTGLARPAYLLADLRQLPTFAAYNHKYAGTPLGNGGSPYLGQCYSSQDSKTWACDVAIPALTNGSQLPPGTGCVPQPDVFKCAYTGYVMFRLNSLDPPTNMSPAALEAWAGANVTEVAHYVNGLDGTSSDPAVFQSVALRGSTAPISMFNPYQGGYKMFLDKSGRYLFSAGGALVIDTAKLSSVPAGTISPVATSDDFALLNNQGGHGAYGWQKIVWEAIQPDSSLFLWDFNANPLTFNLASSTVNAGNFLAINPQSNPYPVSDYLTLDGADSNIAFYTGPPIQPTTPLPLLPMENEIRLVDTSTGATTRVAYLNGVVAGGCPNQTVDVRQPAISPDGSLIAFSTNYGDATNSECDIFGASYMMLVKVR